MSDNNQSSYKRVRDSTKKDEYFQTGDERGGLISVALNSGGMLSLRDISKADESENELEIQLEISFEDHKLDTSPNNGIGDALLAEFEASKRSIFVGSAGKDLFRKT